MTRPGTMQEWVHWFELGGGARWVRLAAVLIGAVALSLVVAWKQFRGPRSEGVLMQADLGRQIAAGRGFASGINYPQASAVLEARGVRFDAAVAFPDLYQAPLYPLAIAGALRALPESTRSGLFETAPMPPDGFGPDYVLLGLNLLFFWVAVGLAFDLASKLFSPAAGWLAALGLMASLTAWQQVVAVNGATLMMALVLLLFRLWWAAARRFESGQPATLQLLLLGLLSGLLFLAEYSAGLILLPVAGCLMSSGRAVRRWAGAACLLAGFACVAAPWMIRNIRVAGHPMALAAQNIGLRAGDITADPETYRTQFSAAVPSIDIRKLANKTLTNLQLNVQALLWSGGGLFFTAFFVTGLLYRFRAPSTDEIRWWMVVTAAVLVTGQGMLNSGETERPAAVWLAPLIIIGGAGFFLVLLEASPSLARWPRLAAAGLLLLQAVPLAREALEPRRSHFSYPPYAPFVLTSFGKGWRSGGATDRAGLVTDIPAGLSWYGGVRSWAKPARLREFYGITLKQPVLALVLTPRTLDRPFFTELGGRNPPSGLTVLGGAERFGEWGDVYGALVLGRTPPGFPLTQRVQIAPNFAILFDPSLPFRPGN